MRIDPRYMILMILLWPIGQILRGVLVLLRRWYRIRPRQFDWLATAQSREAARSMVGTCALSVQWMYETSRRSDLTFALGTNGTFTTAAAEALCARWEPAYAPKEHYLQQVYDQMVTHRELFTGPFYHLGLNEDGQLAIQVQSVIDNTEEPPRERATVVMVKFGRRAKHADLS